MRLISWNVNGLRSVLGKGFREFVEARQPDILCLQETKAQPDQVDLSWMEESGYLPVWNPAAKRGYSGTALFSRPAPRETFTGFAPGEPDPEGRVITADYGDFRLVNVYTPNSQRGLARLEHRLEWDRVFLDFLTRQQTLAPVVFCGDLNCAHREIDLANPKQNRRNAGFTDEEREGLDRIFRAGFLDAFRVFEPGPGHYTWWTYRNQARERNIGWRIDYFGVEDSLRERLASACILAGVHGSDHCPVELELS